MRGYFSCHGDSCHFLTLENGSIEELVELDSPGDYITSVNWMKDGGEHLAVGMSNGDLTLWDASTLRRLRQMQAPHQILTRNRKHPTKKARMRKWSNKRKRRNANAR